MYTEYQTEQLIHTYRRAAINEGSSEHFQISHKFIDHFSTNKGKHILESGVLETAIVHHYMVHAIRNVNAWRLNTKIEN